MTPRILPVCYDYALRLNQPAFSPNQLRTTIFFPALDPQFLLCIFFFLLLPSFMHESFASSRVLRTHNTRPSSHRFLFLPGSSAAAVSRSPRRSRTPRALKVPERSPPHFCAVFSPHLLLGCHGSWSFPSSSFVTLMHLDIIL